MFYWVSLSVLLFTHICMSGSLHDRPTWNSPFDGIPVGDNETVVWLLHTIIHFLNIYIKNNPMVGYFSY